jgi:hypothetical protein
MDFLEFGTDLAGGRTSSKSGLQYSCEVHKGSVYLFLFRHRHLLDDPRTLLRSVAPQSNGRGTNHFRGGDSKGLGDNMSTIQNPAVYRLFVPTHNVCVHLDGGTP